MTKLQRISLSINGRSVSEEALNDILICDNNPARIVRYRFRLRGRSEEHRCSGIWIATPAGSTAAIHSAGGKQQPIESKRLQFLVREPYFLEKKDYKFLHGFIESKESIKIESHMRDGSIYIDGADVAHTLRLGDKLDIRLSKKPLYVFGLK